MLCYGSSIALVVLVWKVVINDLDRSYEREGGREEKGRATRLNRPQYTVEFGILQHSDV